ncbi:MAG: hypothetical protein AB8B83_04165 [Bdellovibrionales bacterium]
MADLSEIPQTDIRALEQAMRFLGLPGITVDGNPEDISSVQLIPFLDRISRALGDSGVQFAQGNAFTETEFNDPEIFQARLADIQTAVEGFRDSPHLGLIREITSSTPDFGRIEQHLAAMGIEDPAGKALNIRRGLALGVDTVLYDGIPFVADGIIPTAEEGDPNFARLREILGDRAMDDIEQTVRVMDAAGQWIDVVSAMGPAVATPEPEEPPATEEEEAPVVDADPDGEGARVPDVEDAVIQDDGGATEAEEEPEPSIEPDGDTDVGIEGSGEPDPEPETEIDEGTSALDVLEAEEELARIERIRSVEATIGIVEPDGVWGVNEQNALLAYIADIQSEQEAWLGTKDGYLTSEFLAFIRGEYTDSNGNVLGSFTDEQRAFLDEIDALRFDIDDLLPEAPNVHTPIVIESAVDNVEQGLLRLVPLVQRELDAQRAQAEGLIESIQGGAASQMERDAAERVLRELSVKEPSEITPEDVTAMEEAQAVLDQSNIANNIGDFVDDFLGLGTTTLGQRMVEAGKSWSIDMVRGQLAGIHDLPSVDSFNIGDGRLDINEQRALQGVTYLLARRFGIGGNDNWHYTPELGQQLLARFGQLDDDEKLLLLSDEDRAAYDRITDEAAKATFLNERFEAEQARIVALIGSMDTLYEAGVLVPQRLYYAEDIAIPEVTHEIFDDYIMGNDDPHTGTPIAAATPEELNMLNVFVYEFTQGLDLSAIMDTDDEDYVFPAGLEPIDASLTMAQRFAAHFREGMDTQEMLGMIDTIPFGTDERREEIRTVVETASQAVARRKEEDPDVSVEILASIFGNAMEAGLTSMNEDPTMGSDYRFIGDRALVIDPRLGETIHPSSSINVQEVFDAHMLQNDNTYDDENDYDPTFFKDENGDIYVAAIDYESNVFTIQELDFGHWRQVVNSTPMQPGENRRDYLERLDDALGEVSGHDLMYQNNHDLYRQVTLMRGVAAHDFPDYMQSRSADILSFDGVQQQIQSEYDDARLGRAEEQYNQYVEEGTPVGPRATEAFRYFAEGGGGRPVDTGTPAQEFGPTASELTAPQVQQGDVVPGAAPVVVPIIPQTGVQ